MTTDPAEPKPQRKKRHSSKYLVLSEIDAVNGTYLVVGDTPTIKAARTSIATKVAGEFIVVCVRERFKVEEVTTRKVTRVK